MRTTITLADDVAAALEKVRRERDLGLSEAVNDLIRAGLTSERETHVFRQVSHDMGMKVDVSNIADALETLEGPASR
jgi:metal-responsive CopG/Arc/MetJ family transcriptional regulator